MASKKVSRRSSPVMLFKSIYLHLLNCFCAKDIEITSSIQFYYGRCHTIRPRVPLKRANKDTGYSMMLHHHFPKEDLKNIIEEDKIKPGWHIFIHDTRDNFTEVHMKASGRVEYVFAALEEEIEIKLQAQQFSNIHTKQNICSPQKGYSDLKVSGLC